MKHWTRKLLQLVFALMTMGVLLTTAFAADTDTLVLSSFPEEGSVSVSSEENTFFYVLPSVNDIEGNGVTNDYAFSFYWTLDNELVSTSSSYKFPAGMSATAHTLTCTVTARHVFDRNVITDQITWSISVKNITNITLTTSQSLRNFYFTSTETQTGTSVYSEIVDALDLKRSTDLSLYQVAITPHGSSIATLNGNAVCPLTELSDIYLSINAHGTWTASYVVILGDAEVVKGRLTIVIEPHISMDLFYNSKLGENLTIPVTDFIRYWNTVAPHATLNSINIRSISGMSGSLCYDHSAAEKKHTNAIGLVMYADSRISSQRALKDITFIPNKSSNKYSSGTLTIEFTASGTDIKKNPLTYNGKIVVFYSDRTADPIQYNCSSTHVMMDSYDFISVYRAVTGDKSKNPAFSLRFLDVPSTGTLYRNYSTDFYGAMNSTALTEENLSILTFSSQSSGANSLDKLAYVPKIHASTEETIRYVVYSGTKLLYVGTVRFSSQEFVITYTTTAPALDFSSTEFYSPVSPLLNAQYVVFGTPSSGTLYKDYADGTGTRVRSGEYFSYQASNGISLLDSITYVPAEGFTGVVEIPFVGYSLTNTAVSGKVRIYVVAKAFTDVDPTNWAAPYINRLYASGIVSGTSDSTFSPNSNVTYGAALKMILNAAGYPKQSETGGTHWASNYLKLAFKKGIVSSTDIDLDATVDRNTIAEIAAKALGLSKASSINSGIIGPDDSENGYVYALYNAGIINGTFVGGKNYFYGDKLITRAEIAKIICMINDYIN